MRTSLEKLQEFIDELEGPPSENPDALELGVKTALQFGGPLLQQLIPDSSAELDELLVRIAAGIINLRSDDAAPVLISSDQVIDAIAEEGERAELNAGEQQ